MYLMLISLLLMAVDLSLTSQATKTSKSNVQRFVLPTCWSTLPEAIGPQDIIEFTYDLLRDQSAVDYFGSNKYFGAESAFAGNSSTRQSSRADEPGTDYYSSTIHSSTNISYQDFIEREILFGDLNGQSSSLIHHLQNIWAKKRVSNEFRFHPLSSEQDANTIPSTFRSLGRLKDEKLSDSTLYLSILITRTLASGVTLLTIIYLILYYVDILHLNISKKLLPENTPFLKQPELVRKLVWSVMLTIIHMPPGDYFMEVSSQYPLQLFTLFRLLHTIKWLRETNPMRYNRMTEILCTLSSVRLRAKFLMKIPFMRNPLTSIIYTYSIILTVSTFTIYSLESKLMNGYCLTLQKSIWVVMVTTTNLGYGDVIVGTGLSKTMLGFTSIAGIAIMALLVNYVSGALVLPADERRIIGFFDKHRTLQLQRIAASNLIKSRWRLFKAKQRVNDHFQQRINNLDNVDMDVMMYGKNKDANFEDELRDLMHDSKIFEIDYQQQHRHWLKIKAQANQIQYQLQKGFTQEDTAIQATYISRKLDDLEAHISTRDKERRKTVAGLNAMGTSEGVAHAHAARVSRVPEIPISNNAVRPSKMVDTTNFSPERKNRMETLRKNTDCVNRIFFKNRIDKKRIYPDLLKLKNNVFVIFLTIFTLFFIVKRRWKRIGNKTIDNNDSKASPWQLSRNPFEALAKQSKKRHQIKINSLNEDDDIHVEKLLAEEEAAIYREEEEAKQAFYQNEQDITQARIENLENMLVGINCCLERLSDKMGVDGPPKAIISQQLSTIEQQSNYENEEPPVLPKSAGSSKPVYSSEVHSSHTNSSHINSNKDISSKSTSKQNSNKELLTTA